MLKELQDKIIKEEFDFNSLSDEKYDEFLIEFNKMVESDKKFYLLPILKQANVESLLEKNYEKLFSEKGLEEVLRSIL